MAAVSGLLNYIALVTLELGFHTVVLIITLIILIYKATGVSLPRVTFSVLLCFVIFIVVEVLTVPFLLKATGKSHLEAFNDPLLRSAFSLPQETSLLVLALLRYKYLAWKKSKDVQVSGKLTEEKI